jgi:hypothetical protein
VHHLSALSFETVGVGGKFAASSRGALAFCPCRPRKMTDLNKHDAHIEWEIPDTWGMLPACACFRHYASDLRIHIHKTSYSYIPDYIFFFSSQLWCNAQNKPAGTPPPPLCGHTLSILNRKAYLIGGCGPIEGSTAVFDHLYSLGFIFAHRICK